MSARRVQMQPVVMAPPDRADRFRLFVNDGFQPGGAEPLRGGETGRTRADDDRIGCAHFATSDCQPNVRPDTAAVARKIARIEDEGKRPTRRRHAAICAERYVTYLLQAGVCRRGCPLQKSRFWRPTELRQEPLGCLNWTLAARRVR